MALIYRQSNLTSGGTPPPPTASWQPLRIGGGGFVRSIYIAPDNTKVCRCDTWGAYIWNGSIWSPLITSSSIPNADIASNSSITYSDGVAEVVIAPNQTTTLYMKFNGWLYVSINSGGTWNRASSGWTNDEATLGGQQTYSFLIGVDPQNPDFVVAGNVVQGLMITSNGRAGASTTWTAVSTATIPLPTTNDVGMGVAFDPTSLVSGGKTQGIYAYSWGNGVYHSTDAGVHWTLTTSGPLYPKTMFCDASGNLWVVNQTSGVGGTSLLWKYSAGTWSSSSPTGNTINAAAVDPSTGFVWTIDAFDNLSVSKNVGSSWAYTTNGVVDAATDVPWLATTYEGSFSVGTLFFDYSGNLYLSEGIAVWHTVPPASSTSVTWTSQTAGIEQMVTYMVLSPPGGKQLAFLGDRNNFYIPNGKIYSATQVWTGSDPEITDGWGGDWAATNPAFIVANVGSNGGFFWDLSGYSTNGGVTWIPFGTTATGTFSISGGSLGNNTWSVVAAGLNLGVGDSIVMCQTSNPLNMFTGTVFTYNNSTGGSLTVNCTAHFPQNSTVSNVSDWTVHTVPYGRTGGGFGGSIAAASTTNFIFLPSGNGVPFYTQDGGVTWVSLGSYFNTTFGIPTSGTTGWGDFYSNNSLMCCADRVNPNTFYMYNSLAGASGGGIYRSIDGGVSWTLRNSGGGSPTGATSNLAKMKSVPGQNGHLFFIDNLASGLWRSQNGGQTWTNTANGGVNFTSVNAFGIGKIVSGQSYPAIFLAGSLGARSISTYGIWQSIDNCVTWTKITQFPYGNFNYVTDIDGDKTIEGNVYGCFQGSSYWGYF